MATQNIKLPIDIDLLNEIYEKHYAIVDDFLPEAFANQLLDDAERLYSDGSFQQHYFKFGGALLKKPSVFELDLSDPDKLDQYNLGAWKEVVDDMGPDFLQRINELDISSRAEVSTTKSLSLQTCSPPAIKLQLNTGRGSFPWHYDNPGPPNNRILTCVVYLNPNWSEGDGGEIVLCPFLSKMVVIPPLHRRAVFFYSDRILHRVLPSNTRRVCFTMWCNGTNVNSKDDVMLSKEHLQFTSYDAGENFFAKSPLQRVISRAVYADEYLESLLQCIVSNSNINVSTRDNTDSMSKEEKDKLIQQHDLHVKGIMKKLGPLVDEFRRRKDALDVE